MADKPNPILRAGSAGFDHLWAYRRELAPVGLLAAVWAAGSWTLPRWATIVVTGTLAAGLVAGLIVGPSRRRLLGWVRCGRSWRQMLAGLAATRAANVHGQLPRVRRVTSTAVGERVELRARPGQSKELLDLRVPELRAALRARTVLIERDPDRSERITIDVVRRNPLGSAAAVPWLDAGADQLSMWDAVHVGIDEAGQPVRLPLAVRGLLIGGLPESGKSTALSGIASHAAKSPDVEMLLIDPNQVQFSAWRRRAAAFATDDINDALGVLEKVRTELDRRAALLESLPGVVRKLTRELSAEQGLPLWLLMIDELAYHTSVVGTAKERELFAMWLRDIVSRARFVGVIPVVATQRPTQDIVPRALSDLFGLRWAFRTANPSNSDVILGEGMAKRGYDASEIDLAESGVGLLLAEGSRPTRLKGVWTSDEDIFNLARTTAPRAADAKPRLHVVGAEARVA